MTTPQETFDAIEQALRRADPRLVVFLFHDDPIPDDPAEEVALWVRTEDGDVGNNVWFKNNTLQFEVVHEGYKYIDCADTASLDSWAESCKSLFATQSLVDETRRLFSDR